MRETDTFYQVKPTTGQISNADIIYLEFAVPILQSSKDPLNERIVFQSILHGITRGHNPHTPYLAAVLCGTAVVLAYTRGVLTYKEIPYPEGGLENLKRELERHKQEYITYVALRLSRILAPFTLWEHVLKYAGLMQCGRRQKIEHLSRDINDLLLVWG